MSAGENFIATFVHQLNAFVLAAYRRESREWALRRMSEFSLTEAALPRLLVVLVLFTCFELMVWLLHTVGV